MLEELASGIVITVIFSIIGWFYRKNLLSQITSFRKIFGGSVKFFENAEKAYSDIEKESIKSRNIQFVGSHNTTFLRERTLHQTLLYRILAENKLKQQGLPTVRFLHLAPSSQFIIIRSKELNYSADGKEIRDGIWNSLRNIRLVEQKLELPKGYVAIRHFDFHLIFRLVLLDDYAYVGFYRIGSVGRESPTLKVSRDSDLYHVFQKFFETLWEYFSEPASTNTTQGT